MREEESDSVRIQWRVRIGFSPISLTCAVVGTCHPVDSVCGCQAKHNQNVSWKSSEASSGFTIGPLLAAGYLVRLTDAAREHLDEDEIARQVMRWGMQVALIAHVGSSAVHLYRSIKMR